MSTSQEDDDASVRDLEPSDPSPQPAREDVERLVHDLRTHQWELEVQNEELRAAQLELQQSQSRYADLYDNAPNGYATVDAHGKLSAANQTMATMLGLAREQLIGSDLGAFTIPDPEATGLRAHLASVVGGDGAGTGELLLKTASGDSRWVRIDSRLVHPSTDTPRVRLAVSDNSVQRAARERERELGKKMAEAQKLESLGVMAGGVAHDFNNLLTAIMGNASLLLADAPAGSPSQEGLCEIRDASERAAELCAQLLTYAGRNAVEMHALDVSELVQGIVRLIRAAISKNVELALELADDLPQVHADATQLRQVVMNLLTNASDAIGEAHGRVKIRTCRASGRHEGRAVDASPGGAPSEGVLIEVVDDGCGMDSATMTRMFEPFFTTKFTGRGLGLASLRGIVLRHAGTVTVSSEPGAGTTVRVLLPATDSRAAQPQDASPSNEAAPPLSGTVLVVDDEAAVRSVAARVLTQAGCVALQADDGRQAVELFRAHMSEIRAVVLDLVMPGMSGVETFGELVALRPEIPVIISSGYSDDDVRQRFTLPRPAGYLHKPYTAEQLTDAVRRVVGSER